MIRHLIKSAVVLCIFGGIATLADRQSSVSLEILGNVFIMPLYEALFYLFGIFLAAELLWFGLKSIVRMLQNDVLISNHAFNGDKNSIEIIQAANKDKIVLSRPQFDEAAILIVKTMSSITSGLMNEARRHLVKLREIIGQDAIIDILMLKIYKGEKNFDKMEELSQKLMQNEDIQLVGMKAALEAQIEKKEFTEALKTVNQAFEVRQDLYWVIGSAFLLRAKNQDWTGALEVLDAGIKKNITPSQKASRLRSVALYELAKQADANNDKTKFFKFITQALNENNKFIPAALDLADYYVKNDAQIRKAEKVLCNIWRENPCYEAAQAYLALFSKDTKAEKIQRMEKLALMNSKRPSLNNLILAELYINAKKYAKARTECKIFLLKNPATKKIADMLKILEEGQHKGKAAAKGIVSSIKRKVSDIGQDNDKLNDCPKDFQWVCANCGHVTDSWEPICPECGEIGRSYWHLYVDKEATTADEI